MLAAVITNDLKLALQKSSINSTMQRKGWRKRFKIPQK